MLKLAHARALPRPFAALPSERVVLALTMAVNAAAFLIGTLHDPLRPAWSITYLAQPAANPPGVLWGWLNWNDQAAYMASARAWWAGNLDPALHAYPAGYMLLGGAFVGLLGNNAFLLPNLGCLLVSQLLFARLFRRLAPQAVRAPLAWGGLVFLVTSGASPWMLAAWVRPWTTTLSTPLTYAALLAAIAFMDGPRRRVAFAAALAGGAIVAVRPADAAPVLLAVAAALTWRTLRPWPGLPRAAAWAGAALGGLGVALAATVLVHVAIYGFALSSNSRTSAEVGFEWRLIPLRWVELVVDSRPMGTQPGLMVRFWWFAPGLAGLLAGVVLPGRRAAHGVIAGAALAHLALFLSYRDLHASGLWHFQNYHYFKWIIPVLGGYAALWTRLLLVGPRLLAGAAMAALLPLFLLRVAPVVLPDQAPAIVTPSVVDLPGGLPGLGNAVVLPIERDWVPNLGDVLTAGALRLRPNIDFKLYPFHGGMVLTTMRAVPPGPARLRLNDPVLDPSSPGVAIRQAIVPGLPCWLGGACNADALLLAGVLDPGRPLSFAGDIPDRFLLNGWSVPEAAGRWTDGAEAGLRLRVPSPPGRDLPLTLVAGAFAWSDKYPLDVALLAAGQPVARWRIQTPQPARYQAMIPASAVAADGEVELRLSISNPRSPLQMDWSRDARALGLQVISLQVGTQARP